MPLKIIRQDITKIACDAIVNPTNRHLIPGGGADLVDARLAGLCVLGAVAGGDGVVRGHMRALGAVQNGRAVLRIQKLLFTHDKAGGVVARPGFVWCDGGRHEWCIEAAHHMIAEIRGDCGKQDPEDHGKIGFALM